MGKHLKYKSLFSLPIFSYLNTFDFLTEVGTKYLYFTNILVNLSPVIFEQFNRTFLGCNKTESLKRETAFEVTDRRALLHLLTFITNETYAVQTVDLWQITFYSEKLCGPEKYSGECVFYDVLFSAVTLIYIKTFNLYASEIFAVKNTTTIS